MGPDGPLRQPSATVARSPFRSARRARRPSGARQSAMDRERFRPSLAVAMFMGPDAYAAPSPAADRSRSTAACVPTWNYRVVHVRGMIELFDDPEALEAHVTALSDRHEAAHRIVMESERCARRFHRPAAQGHHRAALADRVDRGQGEAQPEPRRSGPAGRHRGIGCVGARIRSGRRRADDKSAVGAASYLRPSRSTGSRCRSRRGRRR